MIFLLLFGFSIVKSQIVDDFTCPDEFEGYYPHLLSCDKYWHCQDRVRELKTCGNGLGFLDNDETFTLEQCAELHLVECGSRTELEPAISTTNCPRLFGTFADSESCSVFYKCINGKANRYECPPGLAYDKIEKGCKWADQVPECKNVLVTIDGENEEFSCPRSAVGAFTKHAHPADCRQYFVCIGGVPREYGCPLGTVFSIGKDEFSGKCTDPSEVSDCKNYYGNLEFNNLELSKAGADTGPLENRSNINRQNNFKKEKKNESRNNRLEPKEIKRRPAPPSLQSILDDEPRKTTKKENLGSFRSQLRQNSDKTPKDNQRNITTSSFSKETPNLNRLEVITDRNIILEQKTSTVATTTNKATEFITTENLNVLPDPVKAAPGPNGEDYYYYYYYYDDEESVDNTKIIES